MKQLQNNFTTPEQSKRLLDLGLPADSADCYLQNASQYPLAYVNYTAHIIQPFHDKRVMFSQMEDFIPCWSVGRLIEIYHICVRRGFSFNVCFPNLMNEIMYKLGEANSNGWLDIKKLED
jgi:hypothetical protein